MADKQTYVEKFREIYKRKNGVWLSDELALEYFEKLTALVAAVSSHLPIREVVLKEYGTKQ